LAYDIKYILGNQPTFPSYEIVLKPKSNGQLYQNEAGLYEIGHQESTFALMN
jgi:hypothetical protein